MYSSLPSWSLQWHKMYTRRKSDIEPPQNHRRSKLEEYHMLVSKRHLWPYHHEGALLALHMLKPWVSATEAVISRVLENVIIFPSPVLVPLLIWYWLQVIIIMRIILLGISHQFSSAFTTTLITFLIFPCYLVADEQLFPSTVLVDF